MAVALAIIRNEASVVRKVRMELLHRFQELPGRAAATGGDRGIEAHLNGLHDLRGYAEAMR
jgi:hypothetical protein